VKFRVVEFTAKDFKEIARARADTFAKFLDLGEIRKWWKPANSLSGFKIEPVFFAF